MPAYTAEIEGAPVAVRIQSLDVRLPANGLETIAVEIIGVAGSSPVFLPRQELVVYENGVPLVGGIMTDTRVKGFGAYNTDDIVTEITATGFSIFLTYQYATITLPPGSLKSMMTTLVSTYLTGYGVTLNAAQVDGPALPELTYTRTRIDVILTELMQRATFTYAVLPDKTLLARAVGVTPAPANLIDAGPVVQTADVETQSTIDEEYANRIRGLVTGAGPAESAEDFLTVTDGVKTGQFTDYLVKYPASLDVNGQIWPNGGPFGPMGWGGPPGYGMYEWTWLPQLEPSRLRHDDEWPGGLGASPPDVLMTLRYGIRYPYEVVANDPVDQATFGIREKIVEIPQAMTSEAAQAYVQAILDAQHPLIQTVAFKSRLPGWRPGQTLTITLPRRQVDQVFLIRSVQLQVEAGMAPGDDMELLSSIEAISGTAIRGQFEKVYKDWLGTSAAVSGVVAPAVPPTYSLDYWGDHVPGTPYNDGDIVVASDGIAYICVQDGVTTPPVAWPAGTPAPSPAPAHAPTHNTGGADPITAIDAGVIVSGVFNRARLPSAVAYTDVLNNFTKVQTIVAPTIAELDLLEQSESFLVRLINYQRRFQVFYNPLGALFSVDEVGRLFERNRAVAIGEWQSVPFNAGNFSAQSPMVWTVEAADVLVNRYTLIGKTLHWAIAISVAALSGSAAAQLIMTLPAGLVSVGYVNGIARVHNAGWRFGSLYAAPSQAWISVFNVDYSNFIVPSADFYVWFNITLEVQ